ncbi:hypothetical protein RKD23_003629 [Streptomyces sp. SAI-170]
MNASPSRQPLDRRRGGADRSLAKTFCSPTDGTLYATTDGLQI